MGSTQSESHFEAGPSQQPVPGALLVFSGVAPQLRTVPMGVNAPTVFGREDVAGAALPDERVSRQHCTVSFDGRQFTLEDLGSRNGTWVDGVKVEGVAKAAPGSLVRMAQSIFLLCEDVRRFQAGTVTTEGAVVGPAYRAVLDQIALGARGGATVLVTGENGSGKELAAKTFHEAAAKSGPFVVVNCAAIPATLAESLLFGSVKGSYSDAKDTRGYVREAHGGTLFLDELGELDLKVQAKLLRVVEHNEVLAVGASTYVPVQVRVVSATHRDLRAAVDAGTFREDLYYRLAQFPVRLPPLRERREEIPWLVVHALGELTAHPSLIELAMLRPWPGNVRELLSQVKKAAATARTQQSAAVRDAHLDKTAGMPTGQHPAAVLGGSRPPDETLPAGPAAMTVSFSKEQVLSALESNGWNKAKAQRLLGIRNRTTFIRLIEKYELRRPGDAEDEDPE